jgi:hypothetical protein
MPFYKKIGVSNPSQTSILRCPIQPIPLTHGVQNSLESDIGVLECLLTGQRTSLGGIWGEGGVSLASTRQRT